MLAKLLTLTIASTLSFAGTEGWQSFTPTQGGMKILMPGQPTHATSNVDTPVGKVDIHTYSSQDQASGLSLAVILSDFPRQALDGFSAEQRSEVLEGVQKGFVQGTKGTIVSEKKLRIGQHQGREALIEMPDGGKFLRARFFLVNERVYQIAVVGTREGVTSGAGDEFLKSFRLVKQAS